MGLSEYHLQKLIGKRDTTKRNSSTAQQMTAITVMSRLYSDGGFEEDEIGDEYDTLASEDDTSVSGDAGFFGWAGGLFSEDIVFWFHGTQIKGKNGGQFRGGQVPLFDGAILDLTQVSMAGEARGEEQVVHPGKKGAPAKLVVSPAQSGLVLEFDVDDFVIMAAKNGEVGGFSAVIRRPLSYNLGDGEKLEAAKAGVDREKITLINPRLTSGREVENAVIDERGIRITQRESPVKSEAQEERRKTEEKPVTADSGPEKSGQERQKTEEKAVTVDSGPKKDTQAQPRQGIRIVTLEAGEEKEQQKTAEKVVTADSGSDGGSQVTPEVERAAAAEASNEAGRQQEVQREERKEEAKQEEEKKEEKKEEEDDNENGDDDENEDERNFIDVSQMEGSYSGEDGSLKANLKTGDLSGSKGDAEFDANLFDKTFKFSWGKLWPPEEEESDEAESEEESEEESDKQQTAEKKSPALAARKALEKYYKEVEENSREAAEKLGFAKDALILFFRTGELPENKYAPEDTEKEDKEVKLDAEVPILPGISFVASLEPSWNFGFHFNLELAKAEAEKMPEVELEMKDGKVTRISAPDIERVLSLTAEVMGKIGVTLRLALRAGAGYLFYLEGGLSATGEAKGILADGSDDLFGRGKIELPVVMSGAGKRISTKDAKMTLDAGIGLFGSVGGDIKAASEILDWEKELYSYTFKEWNPANFKGAIYLKQSKSKGHLLNPASWTKEKSEFSVDFFKKHIERQKKYGLVMTNATVINMKIDEGKTLGEKLTGISDKLAKIQEQLGGGPAGGQFAAENSEAYDDLMKELEAINLHLSDLILVGNNRLAEMKAAALEYQQDKHYKSNREKAEAGKEKHEKRYQEMEKWGKGFGEGQEADRDRDAYAHYAAAFDAKGAQRQKKEAQLAAAKNSLANKDALISYEEGRVQKLGSKHNDRIGKLKEMLDKLPEDQRNVPNAVFVQRYREMGANALLDKAHQKVGKEALIKYETERLELYRKEHKKRSEQLEEKMGKSQLNITGENRKKPNKAFAEYYYNVLDGKRFFSEDELIHNHQSGREIVEYELSRLKDRAGQNMDHIQKLEQLKERYEKADATQEEKKAVMAEAQSYYKNAGAGRLGHWGQKKIDIAASASKQDILDYEERRRNKYQEGGGKQQKTYAVEKEALDRLKGISVTEKNSGADLLSELGTDKLKQIWKVYKDWLKGQEDDTVKDMIPLQMILEYESEQKENVKEKLQRRKKTDEQIREDRNYKQHHDNFEEINNKILELRKEQNEEIVEKETKETKESYFKESTDFFKKVKKGDIEDNRLLKEVLEQKMEGYGSVHADRLAKLREFMGLKEGSSDAGKSSKSDAQVWEYYKSIGAGGAFADDYAKQKKGTYSINDMLRFERHEARENSQTNVIKAAVSRKVEATIAEYTTSEGGEKLEEKRKKEKEGGHYDRYMALKEMLEKKESDEKIVEYYLSIGGGGGYVDSLRKGNRFLEVVTPEEILSYEQKRNGKFGEAHARRLNMLKGLDDDMSNEAVYAKYREEVLKDNSLKQFLDKVGIKQNIRFEGTIEPEDVLTPQMIYDYEVKRMAQVTEKHTTRIERLRDADEENAYAVYKEAGGEQGFMRANREQLRDKVSENGNAHSFQNILDYDKMRSEYYQKVLEEINEPLKRIEDAQKQLEKQISEARENQKVIQKYLDASGKKEAFSDPSSFEKFTEETSGESKQNDVDGGKTRIEESIKAGEEAQAEAARIMDEKMKLLEEKAVG